MRKIDLVGKKFGRFTVVAPATRTYQTMWQCLCDCGEHSNVSGINLRTGHTTSCGCFREEERKKYAKRRDFTGMKNPRAKKAFEENAFYVPADSVWYKRASGIRFSAKRKGVPFGFKNTMELAAYVMSIAPTHCPVFGKRFEEGGKGFHPWSPSIDKRDPRKGYVRGNIQVISVFANAMKRNATPAQLRAFAKWILKG